jgi:hypothetical protein
MGCLVGRRWVSNGLLLCEGFVVKDGYDESY